MTDAAGPALRAAPTTPAATGRRFRAARRLSRAGAATAATLALLLAAWTAASAFAWVSPVFLPSPFAVARAAVLLVREGFVDATLAQHLAASLGRVFGALVVSLLVGIPVGVLIAATEVGRGVFDPLVELLRPLPPLAYLPLVIIWFGIGEGSKVLVIALAMIPPIVIATAAGVRTASRDRIRAAESLGAGRAAVLRHVVLPSAVPSVLTGTRIALGAGWTTLVAAELVAAQRGLGFMIQSAAQFLVTDVVIVGILVIAAVATLFELVLRRLERRFVPWSRHL
jgi:taurine transport system permease protein